MARTPGVVVATLSALLLASASAAAPLVVRSEADLPRLSLSMNGSAADVLRNPQARAAFAAQARDQNTRLLAMADIQDRATLRDIHEALLSAALILGDAPAARGEIAALRGLQDKPAGKLMAALDSEAWLDSLVAGPAGSTAQKTAFQARLAALLAPMPWQVVSEAAHALASDAQVRTPAMLEGAVQATMQPQIDKTGALDRKDADQLARYAAQYVTWLPVESELQAALGQYIAANERPKRDIWHARQGVLPARVHLTPVVIGVWDTGVDVSVYLKQLWVAPRSRAGRGPRNGLAYDLEFNRSDTLLLPPPPQYADRLDEARELSSGISDMQAGIASPAAQAAKARLAMLNPAQIMSLYGLERFYGVYGHGTHVAGIALDGNPAARLLVARVQFDDSLVPAPPTHDRAQREAKSFADTITYFKAAHARVVNISWGLSLRDDYERQLAAAGVAEPQRSEQARAQFGVVRAALLAAIKSAPGILFVCGAGNTGDDNGFNEFVPSSFDLPNLLTVGAVDEAGEATSFTTSGKTVRVFANGYHVASHVPGGALVAWSGTSMASPQVANLAAKLLALQPRWSAADVKAAILRRAAPLHGGGPVLIDPKATLADAVASRR